MKNRLSLIFHFALLHIKVRFKYTYFGFAWAAIEPMLYFIVLFVVFTAIQQQGEDFAIYLISGIMIYHIFVRGTSGGLSSLLANVGLLTTITMKRDFFPVVATVAIGILSFVDVAVFFGLMPVFNFVPPWTLVLIPIPLILLLILILGLSYLLSITVVFVRDIQFIWNIFLQSLLFISPIFWYVDKVSGVLTYIQAVNPLGRLIEITHNIAIDGTIPPLEEWLYTSSLIAIIFFVGYFVFQKWQNKIMEVI